MKLYYIEQKTYYKGIDGYDHQMADGGTPPILYLTREKAIQKAEEMTRIMEMISETESTHNNITTDCFGRSIYYYRTIHNLENHSRWTIQVMEVLTSE